MIIIKARSPKPIAGGILSAETKYGVFDDHELNEVHTFFNEHSDAEITIQKF